MKHMRRINTIIPILVVIAGYASSSFSAPAAGNTDITAGHFSREGNSESPSKTTRNNIYIKFFDGQWIAVMHVPYPYATTVDSATITRAMEQAKKKTKTSSYLRGTFGQLKEPATVQIEQYGHIEDRIVFECGSLSPCTIKLGEGHLELIKPGVINEHIIKYNHVVDE